jgi:hypothetical protein
MLLILVTDHRWGVGIRGRKGGSEEGIHEIQESKMRGCSWSLGNYVKRTRTVPTTSTEMNHEESCAIRKQDASAGGIAV